MGGSKTQVVQAPAAPNYQQSMRDVLQAQIDLAPQLFNVESQYQPQYQALQDKMQAQSAKSQLALYQQLQPSYSNLEEQYNAATQSAQTRALQQRAPSYVQAFQQAQGTAGINQALQGYAQDKLAGLQANGTALSPEEQRAVDQESRAAFAARGTALGGQSSLAEVLNRYNYRQAREQQLLQTGTALGNYFQQQSAPAMSSFYQQPMYASTAGGQSAQNAIMSQQQAGPQYFNPESATGMGSIYGAYNSQNQYAAGMAQANAAKSAGKNSMFGSIGGGLLMGAGMAFCWVAREVYGEANPKWLSFRRWMIKDAPLWLFNAYVKYGEGFANFIKDKPLMKRILRSWMDSKIK
ncbi:hypothetical protein UFOVP742_43 [uncultured Caudovirales phage]|uniref:Uncharacterized protein n=1 Tax=uncultured Caudovirales phage TaxID=2100421 RepID=A0A6J7X5H9_9CAUD|nr:hypothetical protein UFOVP742_43 [uncultured Caudovirales phage]